VCKKKYRERYKGVSGRDPFVCSKCGGEMILWQIWHPKYGVRFSMMLQIGVWIKMISSNIL
jgi:hypothetical protein